MSDSIIALATQQDIQIIRIISEQGNFVQELINKIDTITTRIHKFNDYLIYKADTLIK